MGEKVRQNPELVSCPFQKRFVHRWFVWVAFVSTWPIYGQLGQKASGSGHFSRVATMLVSINLLKLQFSSRSLQGDRKPYICLSIQLHYSTLVYIYQYFYSWMRLCVFATIRWVRW
jgi:hypothetical protein